MSHSPFSKLDDIPIKINGNIPKPTSHDNHLFISTESKESLCDPGIYKYDLETNTMNLICKYKNNTNIKLKNHEQFINPQNNLMHIFGGYQHLCYDLKTNKIINNHQQSNELNIIGDNPVCYYIPDPVHQFYIIDKNQVFKYNPNDKNDKNNIPLKVFDESSIFNEQKKKLICIPFKKQLMAFAGLWQSNILYMDINKNIQDNNWKNYSLTMPHARFSYNMVLAYNSLIFLFYFPKYYFYIAGIRWTYGRG